MMQQKVIVSLKSPLLRDHPEINVNWATAPKGLPFIMLPSLVMLKLSNCFWHPNIDVNLRNRVGETSLSLG